MSTDSPMPEPLTGHRWSSSMYYNYFGTRVIELTLCRQGIWVWLLRRHKVAYGAIDVASVSETRERVNALAHRLNEKAKTDQELKQFVRDIDAAS